MPNIPARPQTLEQAGCVATRSEGVRIDHRLTGEEVAQLFFLLPEGAERARRCRRPHHMLERRSAEVPVTTGGTA
ncbi:hypothetical protein [Streptomyces sp. NPDC004230]